MTIYKATVELYFEANDAQETDAMLQSAIAAARDYWEWSNASSKGLIDWARAGTHYPEPATKAEIKALEYFQDNPDMLP